MKTTYNVFAARSETLKHTPLPRLYVREWRKYRGLTGSDLSRYSGVPHDTISRIELRQGMGSFATLFALAAILDCYVDDFAWPPEEVVGRNRAVTR
jgi:transcriptional regulator with XRE-family HTH domain